MSLFEDVANILLSTNADIEPSELQGYYCGLICGGKQLSRLEFIGLVKELASEDIEIEEQQEQTLYQAYQKDLERFTDEAMSFSPLLPEDDYDMTSRLLAIQTWATHFISGIGQSGLKSGDLDQESREILQDLAAIAEIDTDEALGDDAEADIIAIQEHLKLVALNLYFATHQLSAPATKH